LISDIRATNLSSCAVYSYDDVSGDTALNNFNINKAPSYVFSVLNDIKGINPYLKVHLLPWSPVSAIFVFRAVKMLTCRDEAWLDEGQWHNERWQLFEPIRQHMYVFSHADADDRFNLPHI
jgi:hypothetical protein